MWIKKAWRKTNYLSGGRDKWLCCDLWANPLLSPPLLFISTEGSQNKFLCRGIIFLFLFLFFTFWRDCSYGAKAPLCPFCIILVHGWLLPFLSFLFSLLMRSRSAHAGCLSSPAVTFWHQYQRQESGPWVPAWAFLLCNDTQWLAVNPPAKTVLRAHSKETQESINTPCPCLLSGQDCAKATSPGSLIDLFGPHLREAYIARTQTLFPRVLKCFALPFHHGWNELVPIAAPPLLHPLPH